jgi:hypothetical protein
MPTIPYLTIHFGLSYELHITPEHIEYSSMPDALSLVVQEGDSRSAICVSTINTILASASLLIASGGADARHTPTCRPGGMVTLICPHRHVPSILMRCAVTR